MSATDTHEVVIPRHLGLILDGNRRWARERGKTVAQGHKEGYLALKRTCKAALNMGVEYVSAYAFSTENWKRDKQEVDDILAILRWVLDHEINEFYKEGIRLRVIGSRERIGAGLARAIERAEQKTAGNTRGTLLLCFDYGGQQETTDAVRKIVASGVEPQDITPETIAGHLYAPDVPPIDLVVRTSGEQRLSNFMTWESVYSELLFTKQYGPDFDEDSLRHAFAEYTNRQRRFGS